MKHINQLQAVHDPKLWNILNQWIAVEGQAFQKKQTSKPSWRTCSAGFGRNASDQMTG